MITDSNLLLAIAIVVLTGLLTSKISKFCHVPNVTGYLIGGLLIGPGLFSLIPGCTGLLGVSAVSAMKVIVKIELAFIAFTIGCEFKKSFIKSVGAKPIMMAAGESLFAVIVIAGVIMAFSPILTKQLGKSYTEIATLAIGLGAIGAATAPAATLMVIKQYRAKGEVTDTLVATVAIDDATALIFFGLAIAVIEIMTPASGKSNLALSITLPFIEIILSIALGLVMGYLLVFLVRFFHGRGTRLCAILAAVLGCAGLCTAINAGGTSLFKSWGYEGMVMNMSDLFAVMVLGLIYTNFSPEEEKTNELFERFTPPFVMMFFVLSGADLDLTSFKDSKLLIVAVITIGCYVIGRSLGKFVGVEITGRLCKMPAKVTNLMSLGLMPQGGVAIGLSLIASSLPVLEPFAVIISTTIIVSCFLTELFGPLFTKKMLYMAQEADPSLK